MGTALKAYAQKTGTIASLIGLVVAYLIIAGIMAMDDGLQRKYLTLAPFPAMPRGKLILFIFAFTK